MPWLDEKPPGPLSGVKVIDMSNIVFGPFGSQILGDLGADIIKIENGPGDMLRYVGPSHVKGLGPLYLNLHRNKRSLNMDLSKEESKTILKELIKGADVFFHNVRTAGITRLGFDYDTVKAINPSIIYVHCCGYGSGGTFALIGSGRAQIYACYHGRQDVRALQRLCYDSRTFPP